MPNYEIQIACVQKMTFLTQNVKDEDAAINIIKKKYSKNPGFEILSVKEIKEVDPKKPSKKAEPEKPSE